MRTPSTAGRFLCQVCGLDLSLADGNYHRMRRRACNAHIKADLVYIPGHGSAPYRFCHQCAKFEPLTCFDGSRRSCRLKLAYRRVKEAAPASAARLSCSGPATAAGAEADTPAATALAAPVRPRQGSTDTAAVAVGTAAGMTEPCSPVPQLHPSQPQHQRCSNTSAPESGEPAAAAATAGEDESAAAAAAGGGGAAARARVADMLPSQTSSTGASHSQAEEAAFLDAWDAMFQQALLECKEEDACCKKHQRQLRQLRQQWQLQQETLQQPLQGEWAAAAATCGGSSGDATLLVQGGCSPHTGTMMLEGCSSVAAMAAAAAAEPLSPWAAAQPRAACITPPIRKHSAAATQGAAAAAPAAACAQPPYRAVPTSLCAGGQADVLASSCVSDGMGASGWAAVEMQQQQQEQRQEQQQQEEQEAEEDRDLAAFPLSAMIDEREPGAAGSVADTCLPSPITDTRWREPCELVPPVLPLALAAPGTAAAPQAAPAAVPTGCYTGSNGLFSSSMEVVSLSGVQPCLPAEYVARLAFLKHGLVAAADQLRQLQDVAARLGCWMG